MKMVSFKVTKTILKSKSAFASNVSAKYYLALHLRETASCLAAFQKSMKFLSFQLVSLSLISVVSITQLLD